MRAILFDCDGTIADTCGLICEVMRRAFQAHDLAHPGDAQTRAIIGISLGDALAILHPAGDPAEIAVLVESYRTHFHATRAEPAFRESLFPGMKALVEELSNRDDVLIGLVTGKTRRGVDTICAAHGLTGRFLAIRTADDCPSKPHPAMVEEAAAELGVSTADCLVVGDALFDMQMAANAGAVGLGVSWGTNAPDALLAAGASRVAESVPELRTMLLGWIEAGGGTADTVQVVEGANA